MDKLDNSLQWYWDELAITYDLPVQIIKLAYESWDAEEYPKLRDYIDSLKENVA